MDEIVTCPYNSTHRVAKSKLKFHLVKCAEANRNETNS